MSQTPKKSDVRIGPGLYAVLMTAGHHALRRIGPRSRNDWLRWGSSFHTHEKRREEDQMERFNMSMRKYLKEVGVTSQQAIERVVREQNLAGKGKLQVRMVL